jgi:hypothetical protein
MKLIGTQTFSSLGMYRLNRKVNLSLNILATDVHPIIFFGLAIVFTLNYFLLD